MQESTGMTGPTGYNDQLSIGMTGPTGYNDQLSTSMTCPNMNNKMQKATCMKLYRFKDYLLPNNENLLIIEGYPINKNNIINIRSPLMETVDIGQLYNQDNIVVFSAYYDDNMIVYYFIINKVIPNTDTYNILKEQYDINDQHIDFYIKPFLFKRIHTIHTQELIINMIENCKEIAIRFGFPYYHEVLLHKLIVINDSTIYDMKMIAKVIKETQEFIEMEKSYRPGGNGMIETEKEFENLAKTF